MKLYEMVELARRLEAEARGAGDRILAGAPGRSEPEKVRELVGLVLRDAERAAQLAPADGVARVVKRLELAGVALLDHLDWRDTGRDLE